MNDFSGIWLSLDIHRDKINKLIAEFKETDKKRSCCALYLENRICKTFIS